MLQGLVIFSRLRVRAESGSRVNLLLTCDGSENQLSVSLVVGFCDPGYELDANRVCFCIWVLFSLIELHTLGV
jgi:hypothetical protein